MSIVAVVGDVATTTTIALAAGWPDEPLVVEADPSGGSMAAWLDLPASPTLSNVVTRAASAGWPVVEYLAHRSDTGLRVVPAPTRSIEAVRAVAEADRCVVPPAAGLDAPTVLVDVGAPIPAYGLPVACASADVNVVVHRQVRHSARAAAVRVERYAELVDVVLSAGAPTVLAIVGDVPFDTGEIARFVRAELDAAPLAAFVGVSAADEPDADDMVVGLPEDPLAAAVLAGRSGVSARRLARLPLMRSASSAAARIELVRQRTRAGRSRWSVDGVRDPAAASEERS